MRFRVLMVLSLITAAGLLVQPSSASSQATDAPRPRGYDPADWYGTAASPEATGHLEAAGTYAAHGDWERAYIVLSRAAQQLPRDPHIRARLAQVAALRDEQIAAYNTGRRDRLMALRDKPITGYDPGDWASPSDSQQVRNHIEAAGSYAAAGDWERALVVLLRAVEEMPDEPEIAISLGRVSALVDSRNARRRNSAVRLHQSLLDLAQAAAARTSAPSALDFDEGAAPPK